MEQITYLVANYNNGKYFKDLLASLEQQTDPNWLCLVYDDASTDPSTTMIEAQLAQSPVKNKIRLLINERNIGYIGALKKLIAHAITDIVGILDADDALMPEATEEVLWTYSKDSKIGFVYSKHAIMDASLEQITWIAGTEVPRKLTSFQKGSISHIRSFRLTLYDQTEGLDDSMLYSEDCDLVYKLEERTHPVFIDKALYKYRMLPHSQCHDKVTGEIGLSNHIRARQNALRRRGIKGFRYYYTTAVDWLENHPHPLVKLIRPLKVILVGIDWLFKVRVVGHLQRSTRWYS